MTEFDEIYRHYQPKMGRYLARLLGEHEAQDVLQNAMLQVSQSLPEFRGEAALSTVGFNTCPLSRSHSDKSEFQNQRQDKIHPR